MDEKERLEDYIKSCNNITSFPSQANFILCKFSEFSSEKIYEIFASEGIFTRKFDQKMLENCIRISAGTPEQTDKVISVINKIEKNFYI